MDGCLVVTGPFVEKIILFPLNFSCIFVKNQLAILVWIYSWTLNSLPLICESFYQYRMVKVIVAFCVSLKDLVV